MRARALDAVIVALAAGLLLILAFGGVDYSAGPLRIRLHEWIRPALLLALVLALRVWLARPVLAEYLATRGLAALLVAVAAVYIGHHVRVAGGLDSYGYVSAGSLLASGKLTERLTLVSLLPFENAPAAAAPLGYVPAPDGRRSAPRFPLGLPLMMAVFGIFGPNGAFFVPLVAAFGVFALAYALGRDSGLPASGLLAAALTAADPLMMHYGTQPMSDVPATFWLLAAAWLRL